GGVVRSRPAGRRSCRSARRARAPRAGEPRTLDPFPPVPAKPAQSCRHHRPRRHRCRDRQGACGRERAMIESPLVEIEDLKVVFYGDAGRVTHAVDGVDLAVPRGATLGIVGESGCGKSVTLLALMGLLPKGECEISGKLKFDGLDLLGLPDRTLRDLR